MSDRKCLLAGLSLSGATRQYPVFRGLPRPGRGLMRQTSGAVGRLGRGSQGLSAQARPASSLPTEESCGEMGAV